MAGVKMVESNGTDVTEERKYVFKVDEAKGIPNKYPKCVINMNGVGIEMYADSCSPFTLLDKSDWDAMPNEIKSRLEVADIQPNCYNGEPIPIIGMTRSVIKFKERSTTGKIYIVEKGSNILGWQHQRELGIRLDPQQH